MDNKELIGGLLSRLPKSRVSVKAFADFVDWLAETARENPHFFPDQESADRFNEKWFQLKALSDKAVYEWKLSSCPDNFRIPSKVQFDEEADRLLTDFSLYMTEVYGPKEGMVTYSKCPCCEKNGV